METNKKTEVPLSKQNSVDKLVASIEKLTAEVAEISRFLSAPPQDPDKQNGDPIEMYEVDSPSVKDRIVGISSAADTSKKSKILLPDKCQFDECTISYKQLQNIMHDHEAHVLVHGETGTGKEVFALCVKEYMRCNNSGETGDADRPFLSINCAAISESLIESELFGIGDGVASGVKGHAGILEKSENGVIFLDEFSWLPKCSQAKLLRFIETGSIQKIGVGEDIKVCNFRVIVATNADIHEAILPDLLHRFDVKIKLPPLRERMHDLFWFLEQPAFLGGPDDYSSITLSTLLKLITCRWDGNLRDLQKACKYNRKYGNNSRANAAGLFIFNDDSYKATGDVHVLAYFAFRALLSYHSRRFTMANFDPKSEPVRDDIPLLAALFEFALPLILSSSEYQKVTRASRAARPVDDSFCEEAQSDGIYTRKGVEACAGNRGMLISLRHEYVTVRRSSPIKLEAEKAFSLRNLSDVITKEFKQSIPVYRLFESDFNAYDTLFKGFAPPFREYCRNWQELIFHFLNWSMCFNPHADQKKMVAYSMAPQFCDDYLEFLVDCGRSVDLGSQCQFNEQHLQELLSKNGFSSRDCNICLEYYRGKSTGEISEANHKAERDGYSQKNVQYIIRKVKNTCPKIGEYLSQRRQNRQKT